MRHLYVRLRSRRGGLEFPRPRNWTRSELEFWITRLSKIVKFIFLKEVTNKIIKVVINEKLRPILRIFAAGHNGKRFCCIF